MNHPLFHWKDALPWSDLMKLATAIIVVSLMSLLKKYTMKAKLESSHVEPQNKFDKYQSPHDKSKKKFKVVGPKEGDASYKFTYDVKTPPNQFVPILIGKEHKSIDRRLVLDLYNMNFEIWKPKHDDTDIQHHEWVLEKGGLIPVECIVNSSLVDKSLLLSESTHSTDNQNSATLELQLNLSNDKKVCDTRKLMEKELLRNIVTEKNWKKHQGVTDNMGQINYKDENDESITDIYQEGDESCGISTVPSNTSGHTSLKSTPNKKESQSESKEYSFQSEFDAGSFQTCCLALVAVGKEIRNMYSALELVHKQNPTYDGSVHGCNRNDIRGKTTKNNTNTSNTFAGVALDDVQRCIGDLPFIEKRLSRIYEEIEFLANTEHTAPWQNTPQPSLLASAADDSDDILDTERRKLQSEHESKRCLLGYIDFFKLFVPSLFHHTPYKNAYAVSGDEHVLFEKDAIEIHQVRARQLIKLQKRVAYASLRIIAYAKAMDVAHSGWKLHLEEMDTKHTMLKKRLTFDVEDYNSKFDETAVNEYYDPPIHRSLHDKMHDESESSPLTLRAYTVVGCHNIKLPPQIEGTNSGLSFTSDPVLHISSLRHIIESNPELDFLVLSLFLRGTSTIILFVRCNPISEEGDDHYSVYHIAQQFMRDGNFKLRVKLGDETYHGHSASIMNKLVNIIFNGDSNSIRNEQISLSDAKEAVNYFPSSSTGSVDIKNYFGVNYMIDPIGFTPSHAFRLLRSLVPKSGTTSPNILDLSLIQHRDGSHAISCLGSIRIVHLDPIHSELNETEDKNVNHVEASVALNQIDSLNSLPLDETCSTEDIEMVKDVLMHITVPCRVLDNIQLMDSDSITGTERISDNLTEYPVLKNFSDDDIRRHFIAANRDLKETAIRITESAAWRGLMFPIDTRKCQIELSSKQFFLQGTDRKGNPVFYFRNMCQGLWRKDIEASLSATIYKFDEAVHTLKRDNPEFRCTLVVLMGKPILEMKHPDNIEAEEDTQNINEGRDELSPRTIGYHVHTNFNFVHSLITIISKNYPERLMMALVVPNGGWAKILSGANIRRYIHSSRTRSRVIMLDKEEDLKKYISADQLINLAGGNAPIVD